MFTTSELLSGINSTGELFYNLSYEDLYKHEIENAEAVATKSGALAIDTGKFTGRSPKDKYIVRQAPSEKNIWWGNVNKAVSPEIFEELHELVCNHMEGRNLYVTDGFCGANPKTRLKVRIVSEIAWQSHFCKNMFIRPEASQLEDFDPDFTIINASSVTNPNWEEHGLNSEVFVMFNLEKKLAIIGGTTYGGEMKKGIFSIMNYHLPLKGILSMHCSANCGKNGDSALFFGLSGTGKTTLSTDPHRKLIGDDEHGWDDEGIFNLEGGCYAKTIDLIEEREPDIYRAIRKDALLENVKVLSDGAVDYHDTSKTENGRVSYPLYHIDNIVRPVSKATHPNHVIFLTCDAFGVLPPVARLSQDQAMYHFISGYTAKVAGTERGITEPQATFSPCFGGPFLTLHPHDYARLLGEKLEKHQAKAWLVNTGWSGGGYGLGKRMKLSITRQIISSILDGELELAEFEAEPVFGLNIPIQIKEVGSRILNPAHSWDSAKKYNEAAQKLAEMFKENYKKYAEPNLDFSHAGPQI